MHKIRDKQLCDGPGVTVRKVESFGEINQPLEAAALNLRAAQSPKHQPRLDREMYPMLVCMTAEDKLQFPIVSD